DQSAFRNPHSTIAPFPIGFLKAASRFALVDVPQCPIATDAINAALPALRAEVYTKAAADAYKRGATVLLRHSLEGVTSDYEATITEEIALAAPTADRIEAGQPGSTPPATAPNPQSVIRTPQSLKLRFLARDFFQNNPFILPAFTGYVREQAAASGARFLVDAYCGSGLFALSAAHRFERVAGVEISESSVRWAQENAANNGVTNATFLAADAAAIFAGLDFPAADTAVVIDPPRRGCDELFLRQLVAYGPRAIVYVSCDPATQMRDLALLQPAGYALTAVQPFDLFPQTRHLECVITLRKT
ncbi:MAG TPA: methyltransferase domain-containing protein, partial [Opitutaceae bacterium]|nr:methyltransferase domain-containing protein [Opitutaceae bacterium]